jgi:hypothetical protein
MKNVLGMCITLGLLYTIFLNGCTTGVDPSPDPGIVRVTLKSNETDTLLVILGDTIKFSRVDIYNVIMGQGRLYRGDNYTDLYTNTSMERIGSTMINIIQREWLDGTLILPTDSVFNVEAWNSRYVGTTVFEWYVPPGSYDKLQFNLTGIEVFVARPRQFRNPLELPAGVTPIMNFSLPVEVKAGRVTELNLEVLPFQSVRRLKDAYIFDRKVSVASVKYY